MLSTHLAIDLGASSGRALLGRLEGSALEVRVEEVHRFDHTPIETPAGPVWDLTGIATQVFEGLRRGAAASLAAGAPLSSVGVDCWGVDWSVVARSGELVGLPHCYRDPANEAARDQVLGLIDGGAEGLFARTGIQPHAFNTLFQVAGRRATTPELTPAGGRLLLMPDLLHYWLSGELSNERTIASTGGWLNQETADWDNELLDLVGVPRGLLGALTDAGSRLGNLRPALAEELGVSAEIQVVAPAAHDTASAVAAVPAVDREPGAWAYLSSGTWSLLGAELAAPIVTPEALAAGFTNELGVRRDGAPTVRFLRNISGLWLLQELRRDLERVGHNLSFADLAEQAAGVEPLRTLIDPNAADLAAPGGSVDKLQRHAQRSGQPVPESPGALARCCLESLACCYAETLERLETFVGGPIGALYAVGGGIQNTLLNRLTADAIDRPVYAGPVEATAIGNLLVQAMGLGRIGSLDELRRVVARSFPVDRIDPDRRRDGVAWAAARSRYASITG